jgi:hypothetical protein
MKHYDMGKGDRTAVKYCVTARPRRETVKGGREIERAEETNRYCYASTCHIL